MTWSIRWKVTVGTLGTIACGLLVVGVVVVQALERQAIGRFNEGLDTQLKLVEYSLQPLFRTGTVPPLSSDLQERVRDLSTRAAARVTLIREDGTVMADSAVADTDVPALENHTSWPEVQQALATGQGRDLRQDHTTGERTMYRALLVRQPDQTVPIIVRVGVLLVVVDREIAEVKRLFMFAFGLAFPIVLAVSVWLARSITRPLVDMATAVQQLGSGAKPIHIRTTARDEEGGLATALNQLADQLYRKIDELSEDRAQLLAVLTSMVEGVMVLDSRGHVLQINPALERIFGISRVEARGRPYAELFRHQQLNDLITTMLRMGTHRQDEIVLPLTGRCLQIEASPAGGQRENEACAVLVFHDITELRHLEKIRKDFVANVSHELRTPLTSIKGYVEALLDGAKDDPESSIKFLDIILKQSDRLNLIITDLLELSKIESGRVSLKKEPVDLRAVVERTSAIMKPLADKSRHHLVMALDSSLPSLEGDEGRLVQVLTNLLDNAIKYTPPGGTITVSAAMARSVGTAETLTKAMEICIADTGIGIPEQDRPRVFERFYRVDKARSRELGGTGLGLAIVKHLVEGHGGQVWVEANQPHGSRFVVRFPIGGPIQLTNARRV